MKILLVHNRYQIPGGEEVVFEQERQLLERAGHQVLTYCRTNFEADTYTGLRRLNLVKNIAWSTDTKQELGRLLRDEKPQIVHVHNTFMMMSPSVFAACREAGVPVVISHHKLVGVKNFGRSTETLKFIAEQMRHQPICLDCYPYPASSTILSAHRAANATRVTVTWSRAMPAVAGMDLSDIVARLGGTQEEVIARLLPAGAIYYMMDDGDVQRILQFGPTMIGSDGLPHDEAPHPRLWASFPRVLGHYGRGLGLFSFETAIHKMTGLTAKNFGLAGRGVVEVGAFADLTLLDPDSVAEGATFTRPIAPAVGIHSVIVNGVVVWRGGQPSGARPGRVLRRHDIRNPRAVG